MVKMLAAFHEPPCTPEEQAIHRKLDEKVRELNDAASRIVAAGYEPLISIDGTTVRVTAGMPSWLSP